MSKQNVSKRRALYTVEFNLSRAQHPQRLGHGLARRALEVFGQQAQRQHRGGKFLGSTQRQRFARRGTAEQIGLGHSVAAAAAMAQQQPNAGCAQEVGAAVQRPGRCELALRSADPVCAGAQGGFGFCLGTGRLQRLPGQQVGLGQVQGLGRLAVAKQRLQSPRGRCGVPWGKKKGVCKACPRATSGGAVRARWACRACRACQVFPNAPAP